MKRIVILLAVLMTLLACPAWAQQKTAGSRPVYYDTFSTRWLNPNKWSISDPCGPMALECVRAIENGRLRLAGKIFGATDSDSGGQGMEGALFFANPSTVNSITTDITLTQYSGIPCSTNADGWTGVVADVAGTFFNAGTTNDYADDVTAGVALVVDTNSPATIHATSAVNGSSLNVSVDMGSYPIGTPLTVTVAWNKANHSFFFAVHVIGDAGLGKRVWIPYSVSDTNPPAWLQRNISASPNSANCTSVRTFSAVEAFVDNVIVNAAPPSQNQQ